MNEEKPYVGPAPFERKDEEKFFGRDFECNQLVSKIVTNLEVILYAQSGAGKTSLINAKLIPLLEKEGYEVFSPARVRGMIPVQVDPGQISNLYMFFALLNWAEKDTDSKDLINLTLIDFLSQKKHRQDEDGVQQLRILILDQFEELFLSYQTRWRERKEFFKQIRDALNRDPLLRVLFALREDYVAKLDPYATILPEKLKTRFHLELLRKPEAQMAVEGPVRKTHRSYEEGVTDFLVEELMKIKGQDETGKPVEETGEFIEPVQIQVVCESLWSGLGDEITVIRKDHLDLVFDRQESSKLGFVDKALLNFYDRIIQEAINNFRTDEDNLRQWFKNALITSLGTRGAAQKPGDFSNELIDFLVDKHLIRRVQLRPGAEFYELIHDRFIKPIQESNTNFENDRRTQDAMSKKKENEQLENMLQYYFEKLRMGKEKVLPETTNRDGEKHTEPDLDKEKSSSSNWKLNKALTALKELQTTDTQNAWTFYERGNIYYDHQQYEEAISEYKRAIEFDPYYRWAYFSLGYALQNLQRFEEAEAALQMAIELDPNDANAFNDLGNIYFAEQEYDKAVEQYNMAVNIEPLHKWAHRNRGIALQNLHKYEEAKDALQMAIELDPNYADAFNDIGNIYLDQQEYDKALEQYNKAINIDPLHKWAHRNRGTNLQKLRRYEEAEKALQMAIELDPKYADAFNDLGNIYFDQLEYDKALEQYNKAINIDPHHKWAHRNKGTNLQKLRRYEEAEKALQMAIELDPKYADAFNDLGNIYFDQLEYDKAVKQYDMAINIDAHHKWAHRNRGMVLQKLHRYEEAEKALQMAIELEPSYTDAYNDLGNIYFDQREYDKALELYNKAINIDPGYVYAYVNKGDALTKLLNYDEALDALEKAISIDPEFAESYGIRGEVYFKLDKPDDANQNIVKAIELIKNRISKNPEDPLNYWNLGWYYYKVEEYDQSLQATQTSLNLNPLEPVTHFNLGLVYLAKGDKKRATQEYFKGIEKTNALADLIAKTKIEGALEELEWLIKKKPDLASEAAEIIANLRDSG